MGHVGRTLLSASVASDTKSNATHKSTSKAADRSVHPTCSLAADMDHRPRSWHEVCFADVVTLFFSLNYAADKFHQLFV